MMAMKLKDISRKLLTHNWKQYGLYFFSIIFSIGMVGAYGVLQYSPTVTNVLVDGGSTHTISQAMFFGTMLGIVVFLVYANSIFLKYKSREIGIFLSLGINRHSVQKIVLKEYTLLFQIAAFIGLIISIPLAYFCWSILNLFLETGETVFQIGYSGLVIAVLFSLFNWATLFIVNFRYIKNVDILKIMKGADENEIAKVGNLSFLMLGVFLVPFGIITFFTLQNIGGFLFNLFAYMGLVGAVCGVYVTIIQFASFGDILKKHNTGAYYKNIVFNNLLKQKIRQYTRSIFVATLLITFTIFGIGFIAAGFIEGYNVALNEPYDYTIYATYENPMTKERIEEIADKSNVIITDMKNVDALLLGVENNYQSGESDWSSRIILSQESFNALSGTDIFVPKGSFTLYYDSSMDYKLNAFAADSSLFYNPTTKQEFTLSMNEPLSQNGLFNKRSIFSSFLVLNDEDYQMIANSLSEEYKVVSHMVNVENWRDTSEFQNNILKAVISDNDGYIFTNWHNSAIFSKTGSEAEYLSFEGNETKVARLWSLYPLSKLSSTTTQFEAFATYLMLMLFIAISAFISAVMIIGLKLISTIWEDGVVLGTKRKGIKALISKQMLFVYFIPTVLGCIIGAFTTYRIMLVSGVIYISETMQLVGMLCILVFVMQIFIFFILRARIISNYAQRAPI